MKIFSIICIRTFSLYLIVSSTYLLGPVFFYPQNGFIQSPEFTVSLIASAIIPALCGILLWILSPRIANLMHKSDVENETPINDLGLVRAGTFLLGLYYIIRMSGIFITSLVINHRVDINSTVLLIFAVILVIGNGLFVGLYKKLKYFGKNT